MGTKKKTRFQGDGKYGNQHEEHESVSDSDSVSPPTSDQKSALSKSSVNKKKQHRKGVFSIFKCWFGVKNQVKPQIVSKPFEENKELQVERQDSNLSVIKRRASYRRMHSEIEIKKDKKDRLHPNSSKGKSSIESNVTERKSIFQTKIAFLGKQLGENRNKKTLVLSLDETLIHTKFSEWENFDGEVWFNYEEESYKCYVFKRPFLDLFLEKMSKVYEIVFFTSAIPEYANKVINIIDPNKIAAGRLYRDAWLQKDGVYIKNYGNLGREPDSFVILDNMPTSYCYNIDNAVPIKSWFISRDKDTELLDLVPILMSLSKVKDVRKVIMNIINQMADNYTKMNKIVYEEYQVHRHIETNFRRWYHKIIGNYHKDMKSYNSIALLEKYPNEIDMVEEGQGTVYNQEQIDMVIFQHLQNNFSHVENYKTQPTK